jgi:hypothetical protein
VEVRDPVHGSIAIDDAEIQILEHPFFQRLRNIKQLGFAEYVFPGATHTRYLHSIGLKLREDFAVILEFPEVMSKDPVDHVELLTERWKKYGA